MRANYLVLALAAVLAAAVVIATVAASARADSGCDPGYTLTSGGVTEADLNGDGLTCEVAGVDGDFATLIALDNAPYDPTSTSTGCPDGFTPFFQVPGVPPDRNGNGITCFKITSAEACANAAAHMGCEVFIDDAKSNAP